MRCGCHSVSKRIMLIIAQCQKICNQVGGGGGGGVSPLNNTDLYSLESNQSISVWEVNTDSRGQIIIPALCVFFLSFNSGKN